MKIYDTGNVQDFQGEQEAVARALRNAQALKQQAYGGVPSNANPFHYLANYLSQRNADAEMEAAEKRAADVSTRERTDANDLIAQLTAPQNRTVLSQTLGGSDAPLGGQNVAPMTETQQPMSEVDAAQARLPMALRAMQNPRTAALGQAYFTQGLNAPVRAEERAASAQAKQEAAAERYRQEELARKDRFGQQEDMARLAASLRQAPQAPAAQVIQTDQGIFTLGRDGSLTPLKVGDQQLTKTSGSGGAGSPAQVAKQKELEAAPTRLDGLLDKLEKNPDSFGIASAMSSTPFLPKAANARLQTAFVKPEDRVAKTEIMREAARETKALYGTAVTRGEGGKASTFIVEPDDDAETVKVKLTAAREYAKSLNPAAAEAPAAPTEDPAAPVRKKYNAATGRVE